jgi:hypothetical protein
MTDEQQSAWLELTRDDFLSALKKLKPGRMLKSYLGRELQIGLLNNEGVFCIDGAQTRRPAHGDWSGFVCVTYGMLLPFLKVPPDADPLRITFEGGRLRIGTMRMAARWIKASPWISEMALEAHFMSQPNEPPAKPLYCPNCGKRKGIDLSGVLHVSKPKPQEKRLLDLFENTSATHGCTECLHAWAELDKAGTAQKQP